MLFAVTKEAADAASAGNGLFHGYPPWLLVIVGAFLAALVLWIFSKLLKWALWILILVVLVGGIIVAVNMFFGH